MTVAQEAPQQELPENYERARQQVLSLSAAERTRLLHEMIDTLVPATQETVVPSMKDTLSYALGRLSAPGVTPPTDDEVKELIEQARAERYG